MPVSSITSAIDNLYTTTWQNQKADVADNIFDATPFWFWLRENGGMKEEMGGRFIQEPLAYSKNEQIYWLSKGGTVQIHDFEFLTDTKWDWRYVAVSISRFFQDDQQNRGKHRITSLMNQKLDNARNSLIDALEDRLAGGAGSASTGFDGLQALVADDPTASVTVGGIAQDTYTWWRNQTLSMNTESFATLGVDHMRTMVNNCSNNRTKDRPNIIVSGQTPYEFYEAFVVDNHLRVTNTKLAEAGFDTQTYKGIPMVWSPAIANTRMYFLNTRFLRFVYDPIAFFDMTEWKPIPEQPGDRAAQIMLVGALTTNRRRVHGVIHTIDTA